MNTCSCDIDDRGVAWVTLQRPQFHNALDDVLLRELAATLQAIQTDPVVRVLVLRGAGSSFCAGADLGWLARGAKQSRTEHIADARLLADVLQQLAALPQPTIACVHGAAMGGGLGLVAACDMAIAADGSHFGLTEVRLGLIPAVIGPYVVAAIGRRACQRYMLTGERFEAATAAALGLIHQVAPAANLAHCLESWLAELLCGAPGAQQAIKQSLDQWQAVASPAMLQETTHLNALRRLSAEGQEGIQAFLQKRPPAWQA